ncbi:ki-ras-induced actin-interacting protein-IP3R-interacting domain olf186-M isoform X1 [Dermacentor variabilis]|uniref:ki-ras-induced actin-interacting protein-IP3R-interacting domain olf186-M isoform X1 n=1 Tax=Dermacentor variabilis TaxID=34621 RepID=UPI003F5BAC67
MAAPSEERGSSSSSQGCGVGRSAQAWLSRAIQSLSPKFARKFQQGPPSSGTARRASCSRAPSSESLLKVPPVQKKRAGSAARPSSLPSGESKRTSGVSKQRRCRAPTAPITDPHPSSCTSEPDKQHSALLDAASTAGPATSQSCEEAACLDAHSAAPSRSEAYGVVRLREVLAVLRSDISSEEKLLAIKRGHDRWLALGSPMGDVSRPRPGSQHGAESQHMRRSLHKLQDMKQLGPILELPKDLPRAACNVITVDMSLAERTNQKKVITTGAETPPKSPTSVQEWVNSLPADEPHREESSNIQPVELPSMLHQDSGYQSHLECPTLEAPISETQDDNLSLGAEARTMDDASLLQPKSAQSSSGKAMLAELRSKQSSFNSETSGFSTISSMSSVESLLEARREDPEELLLALGFGGPVRDENPVSRIPERFLAHPSQARGVDMRRFVTHQEQLSQRHEAGLPAPVHQSSPPSAISSKIIEAMEQNQKTRSFSATAKLARTSSLLLSSASRGSSDSILEPANREFLERQGAGDKMSGHKRLVLGHQTFSFDLESGLMLLTSERRRMRWRWRRAVRIILDKRQGAHVVELGKMQEDSEHPLASLDGPSGDSGLGELISVNGGSVDSTSCDLNASNNNGHKNLPEREQVSVAPDDEGDVDVVPTERHKRPLLYRQSTITEEVASPQPGNLLDSSNQDGSEESGEHTLTELSDLHRALREYKAKHLRCGSSLVGLVRKTQETAPDLEAIWQLREAISQEVKRADSMLSSHEMAALLSQPCTDCVNYTLLKEKLSELLSLQKDLCSRISQILEQGGD